MNVLILARNDPYSGYLEDISSVSSEISVKDGIRQLVSEERQRGVNDYRLGRLERFMNHVKGEEGDLDSLLAETEVIFGTFPQHLLKSAPNLKWVHITSAGVNRYEWAEFAKKDIIVTNGRGATAIPIAEHALMFMIMLAKNARKIILNKMERRWEKYRFHHQRRQGGDHQRGRPHSCARRRLDCRGRFGCL